MKKIIYTGEWDGEPIWREETPEETINRKLGEDKNYIADIFINLNEIKNEKKYRKNRKK